MDATLFDIGLRQGLADPEETIYTKDMRLESTYIAVREYSRYRKAMRRFSTGELFQDVLAAANTIQVVGGNFLVADEIKIDALDASSETFTVSSVKVITGEQGQTTGLIEITLSGNLVSDHSAGAYIIKTGDLGLQLIKGQDTYVLPYDWVEVDQESFDLAVGAKSSVRRTNSFYDASYVISNQLSGVGFGQSQGFGPAWPGYYPIAGNPFDNPNGMPGGLPRGSKLYRFLKSSIPKLVVTPAPSVDTKLDFYYFGNHTIQSVPDDDFDAAMSYAKYVAASAHAAVLGAQVNYNEDDVGEQAATNAQALLSVAQQYKEEFDIKIRMRPFAIIG